MVHIRYNGIHIPTSPVRVRAGVDDVDPLAVRAYGPGLGQVVSNVKTEFTIETRNAGQGNLAVTVDGPAKVTMECSEIEVGYKVRYAPTTVGEYFVSVRYNGTHIRGSLFKVGCVPTPTQPNQPLTQVGQQQVVTQSQVKSGQNQQQNQTISQQQQQLSQTQSKTQTQHLTSTQQDQLRQQQMTTNQQEQLKQQQIVTNQQEQLRKEQSQQQTQSQTEQTQVKKTSDASKCTISGSVTTSVVKQVTTFVVDCSQSG